MTASCTFGTRLMRIAIVSTSYPEDATDPSGHFVRAEALELERAGHEVVVVAPRHGGAFGWPGVGARIRENPLRVVEAARWVARARTQIGRMKVDRVVAHWALPCAWPVGVASGAEVDVVSHGGDVRLLVRMPRALRVRIVRSIAERATRWRFVSASLRHALLAKVDDKTRTRLERIATVQAARIVMPDVADEAARKARALAGKRFAVSVGRLVPTKRVDRVIEYVARRRADVEGLVVVGDGPDRGKLEALARARNVDARFVGLVPREEALAWIAAAQMLVFASEAEGASTVLREAEALGTRVIRV